MTQNYLLQSNFILHSATKFHYVKSIRIRSFAGPYFPTFGLNTDQKNSQYGHFSLSVYCVVALFYTHYRPVIHFYNP